MSLPSRFLATYTYAYKLREGMYECAVKMSSVAMTNVLASRVIKIDSANQMSIGKKTETQRE
jgi:hypothetical protein